MLLRLPTFHAAFSPCPVNPTNTFTPHEQGHFCGSCQRVVQDFSQSQNPVADLAAARAASPDGRVCGTFRREQVVVPAAPTLSRQMRWFVVALVLVVGQGLTAREALAQVRKPMPHTQRMVSIPQNAPAVPPTLVDEHPSVIYGAVVELMPSFQAADNGNWWLTSRSISAGPGQPAWFAPKAGYLPASRWEPTDM
jgi:hypothetical protein